MTEIRAIAILCVNVMYIFSVAKKYRTMKHAALSEQFMFSWRVFACWDFNITSPGAATAKKNLATVSLKVSRVTYTCTRTHKHTYMCIHAQLSCDQWC